MTVGHHLSDGAAYYAYDENGNRIMLQDPEGTTYWTYDSLDSMTKEEGI